MHLKIKEAIHKGDEICNNDMEGTSNKHLY